MKFVKVSEKNLQRLSLEMADIVRAVDNVLKTHGRVKYRIEPLNDRDRLLRLLWIQTYPTTTDSLIYEKIGKEATESIEARGGRWGWTQGDMPPHGYGVKLTASFMFKDGILEPYRQDKKI